MTCALLLAPALLALAATTVADTQAGPLRLRTAPVPMAVANGPYYRCVLERSGNLECDGSSPYGGPYERVSGDAVGVSAGMGHMCVVLREGNVDCSGANWGGQAEDYLGGDAVAVAAGSDQSCALLRGGNMHCWGSPSARRTDYLGGDAVAVTASGSHTCVLTSGGDVHCTGNNVWGESVDRLGGDALAVAAGSYHTCALLASGNVDCYGAMNSPDVNYGQAADYLGGDAVAIDAGETSSCAVLRDGNVHCWGAYPGIGALPEYLGGDAVAVQTGQGFTCVLLRSRHVDCDWDIYLHYDIDPPDIEGYAPLPAGWVRETPLYARLEVARAELLEVRGAPRAGDPRYYDVEATAAGERRELSVYTAGLLTEPLSVALLGPAGGAVATVALDLDRDPSSVCLASLGEACLASLPADPGRILQPGQKASAYLRVDAVSGDGTPLLHQMVGGPVGD